MSHILSAKRLKHLDVVDMMPPGLRQCVHEFGLPIVQVLTKFGVRDPRHIREVVKEIWGGARQEGQRTNTISALDFILSRGPVSSATLLRMLSDNNLAIVSTEPTRAMLDASMTEVSGFNVHCTKEEKHRRRLRAALRSALGAPPAIPSVRSRFPETSRSREKSKYEPTRDRGSAHFDKQASNPTRIEEA